MDPVVRDSTERLLSHFDEERPNFSYIFYQNSWDIRKTLDDIAQAEYTEHSDYLRRIHGKRLSIRYSTV